MDSALKVNQGIPQPPDINPRIRDIIKKRPGRSYDVSTYLNGIKKRDISVLAQSITLIESTRREDREKARELVSACLPLSGNSVRIGITGVPGVGKSTFIETFGKYITDSGHRLAVLAIDPSSERSKGSILGDKTRMETLANNPRVFIRPSPSGGSLGGVARKTREAVLLCEAAGFDTIFIETVGVGQSETAVHSMTDFFLLLMLAGAGDGLQGIKRGIMEMSDLLVINKADGNNVEKALQAKTLYQGALHLFPPSPSGWIPTALTASSTEGTGMEKILESINGYMNLTRENGYFQIKRAQQAVFWMRESINNHLVSRFYDNPRIKETLPLMEEKVKNGQTDSFRAASELLKLL
jgi:LAO/AO transport system kinase